jgi:SOS-response transcriptional repressor LexA
MDNFAKRVKARRKKLGLSQAEVATLSGLKQPDVSKIELGQINQTTQILGLAKALKCNPGWLKTGDGPMEIAVIDKWDQDSYDSWRGGIEAQSSLITKSLIEGIYPVEFSIPLLSWVRAGAFCEAPGSFTREDAEEMLPRPLSKVSVNTFALLVVGDSMDAPGGYREGEIVYIDPDVAATPGRDVLAKTGNKMTLKRYKVDEDGQPYLLQLNGQVIIRPVGEWRVCGVVVYAGRRC